SASGADRRKIRPTPKRERRQRRAGAREQDRPRPDFSSHGPASAQSFPRRRSLVLLLALMKTRSPAAPPPPAAPPGSSGPRVSPAPFTPRASAVDALAYVLSIWFGCGLIPYAPGTAGTIGALPIFWFVRPLGPACVLAASLVVSAVGVWASHRTS